MQHFAEHATELGLTLSSEQCLRFEQYAAALAEWNERFNLTTITEPAQVETHHFLDSLSALPVLAAVQSLKLPALLASTPTAIDVGTGAGLPGLTLKLVWPGLQLTLLEGTGKKVTFLEHMIQLYGLSGVRAVHGRAEELAGHAPWREGFDLVLARAVAPLPILLEYLLPLARVGGWILAYKGAVPQVDAELAASGDAITQLGGQLISVQALQVPGLHERRSLIVMRKVKPTPRAFPRASGVIRKRPLGSSQ
ncbi:MAG: 16S rRNA (guanine(527)-N(7))-methyltransferase RsmG [Anaerolineae bacterium]